MKVKQIAIITLPLSLQKAFWTTGSVVLLNSCRVLFHENVEIFTKIELKNQTMHKNEFSYSFGVSSWQCFNNKTALIHPNNFIVQRILSLLAVFNVLIRSLEILTKLALKRDTNCDFLRQFFFRKFRLFFFQKKHPGQRILPC